jgi:hypothetical protein
MKQIFDMFDYFDNIKAFCDGTTPIAPVMVNGVATVVPPVVNHEVQPVVGSQTVVPPVAGATAPIPPVATVEVVPQVKNVEPYQTVEQVFPESGAAPIAAEDPNNDNMNFGNPIDQDDWRGAPETEQGFARGGAVRQRGSSSTPHDKAVKAKRVGYRFTEKKAKKLGKSSNSKPTQKEIEDFKNGKGVYYENRKNRSDKKRMKNL